MNRQTKLLIIELLKHRNAVESWGVSDIGISCDSLSFCVQGLRYSGRITVTSQGGDYVIASETDMIVMSSQLLERLPQVLDDMIERTDNYIQDLCVELSKQ